MNFETQLFQYLENLKNNLRNQPIFLGGTASWGGGIGGPPGGFIGYLPQNRVAYDFGEIASSGIPISGMSLWDNLNHIRYRIQQLEDGGVTPSGTGSVLFLSQDGTVVASGVTLINFVGATVTETGTGEVTVTISSSGVPASGITGINVEAFTDITTLHFSGATVTNPSSNEVLISIDIPTPSGGGDMYKSVYDINNNGIVDTAESVPWSGIIGTPVTFPPATHNHDDRYYTETEVATSGQASINWANIISIPNLLLDAPADGSIYGRQDSTWVTISGGVSVSGISEAPIDGIIYGRQNGTWVETISGLATSGDDTSLISNGDGTYYWGYPVFFVDEIDGSPSGGFTRIVFPAGSVSISGTSAIISFGSISGILEAPIDGNIYGRQNGDWSEIIIPSGISSITVEDVDTTLTGITTLFIEGGSVENINATTAKIIISGLSGNMYSSVKDYQNYLDGALYPASGVMTFIVGNTCTISGIYAYVENCNTEIIFDVNRNGTTLYTTQANRPTCTNASLLDLSIPDSINLSPGEIITVDIDSLTGSASNLTIAIITEASTDYNYPKPKQQAILTFAGNITVGENPLRIYNTTGSAKTILQVHVSVATAPTGSDILVDIHKNGTTIFTNQSNRPTVTASANTGISTTIDVSNWPDGEYLTASIDQIGSSVSGANLVVNILFE